MRSDTVCIVYYTNAGEVRTIVTLEALEAFLLVLFKLGYHVSEVIQ